jgi:hypothetical protein
MNLRKTLPFIFLPLLFGLQLSAQTSTASNHAFSAQMGSGIYLVDNDETQIYRLSGSVGLRSPLRRTWGLRLRLPLTVGFSDFKVVDVFNSGLPQEITAITLLPSLEIEHFFRRKWLASPFVGFGAGIDCRRASHQWITLVGLRNQFIFLLNRWEMRLNQRLFYSELLTPAFSAVDDLAGCESGIEFRRPVGLRLFGQELDVAPFFSNYIYHISPRLLTTAAALQKQVKWEIGLTVGAVRPGYFFGIRLPRAGVSYRFGKNDATICLLLGTAFPIDSPRSLENFKINWGTFKHAR